MQQRCVQNIPASILSFDEALLLAFISAPYTDTKLNPKPNFLLLVVLSHHIQAKTQGGTLLVHVLTSYRHKEDA